MNNFAIINVSILTILIIIIIKNKSKKLKYKKKLNITNLKFGLSKIKCRRSVNF